MRVTAKNRVRPIGPIGINGFARMYTVPWGPTFSRFQATAGWPALAGLLSSCSAKSSIQKWSVLDRLLRNTSCIRSKHLLNAVIELRSIMLVEGCLHPFGGRSDALSVGWAIIIESACLTDSCQTVLSSGEDPR